MNKNKYTQVEKQMQSAFGSENLSAGDWNAPDDGMFLAALEEIKANNEEKDRPSAIYLSGILIFMLLLLLIGNTVFTAETEVVGFTVGETEEGIINDLGYSSEIDSKTESTINVSIPTEASAVKLEQLKNTNEKVEVKEQLNIVENISRVESLNSEVADNTVNVSSVSSSTVGSEKNNINSIISTFTSETNLVLPVSNSTSIVENNDKEEASESTNSSIASEMVELTQDRISIDFAGIDVFNAGLLDNRVKLQGINDPVEIKNPSRKFELVAQAGLNFNSFVFTPVGAISERETTQWKGGQFLNLGVKQHLSNRFSLLYDIGYSRISNESRYHDEMIYDENNMTFDAMGNEVYNCDLEVNSPTTNFLCNVDLRMNHDMENNENMKSVTEIIQNYEVVRVGIRPQYDVYKKNRLSVNAGIGFSANYITTFEQKMDFKLFHDTYIMARESMFDDDAKRLNRFFVSASANTTVSYNWTDRISTGIQASYGRSLNSINRNGDTFLRDLKLGLVGTYSF